MFEALGCFLIVMIFIQGFSLLGMYINLSGLWTGILAYLLLFIMTIGYVVKIERKPLSYIGLKKPEFWDLPKGLALGLCMFTVQQIPLLIMKADYSTYALEPEWDYMIVMSLYCFLCVGVVEELMFRGFILQKTQELFQSKAVAIGINILLFYAVHMTSMRVVFGEFYSIAVNTIFLCVYFFRSKNKSLVPLMIAHGFYDILTSVLFPVLIFLMG